MIVARASVDEYRDGKGRWVSDARRRVISELALSLILYLSDLYSDVYTT